MTLPADILLSFLFLIPSASISLSLFIEGGLGSAPIARAGFCKVLVSLFSLLGFPPAINVQRQACNTNICDMQAPYQDIFWCSLATPLHLNMISG